MTLPKEAKERGIVRDSLSQLQKKKKSKTNKQKKKTQNENKLEMKRIFKTNIGKFRKVPCPGQGIGSS